ncbi:MAG: M14 family zinc carboxypeptidase [Gemmatimonadota bacterium]|nr:M14 family zinc carboxypeptidase [Gemmatimonadota bacterium]
MRSLEPTLSDIEGRFADIRRAPPLPWPLDPAPPGADAVEIGRSRQGRPIHGFRVGTGPIRVSVIGGCHADEPVGPRLLGRLVPYLQSLEPADPFVAALDWWIIPHINPDGAELNRDWQHPGADRYAFSEYLPGRVRELPGDDVEFGFPRGSGDGGARPENAAAARWWESADGPFDLHATLHGMAWAGGPWFLLEPAWVARTGDLRRHCTQRVAGLGYTLHDVERHGEKGFVRIGPGFATRPNSVAMRDHFVSLDDPETAGRFYRSSMEFIGSLGGDPLTLVSEMPLFVLPGVGETLGPPDPALEDWRARIAGWAARLASADRSSDEEEAAADEEELTAEIEAEASAAGLRPMPVIDQMRLQWAFLSAAIATVVQGR